MKLIGISGYIGSGKSTLLSYINNKYHIKVIEADIISKSVIKNQKIIDFLKLKIPSVINDNKIDKKKLRNLIFTNKNLNDQFTSIIWPLITEKIKKILKSINYKYEKIVIIEAAVITGLNLNFDKIILLKKEEETRMNVVLQRDETDISEIKMISNYQKEKLSGVKFDYILENNANINIFYKNIDKLMKTILF